VVEGPKPGCEYPVRWHRGKAFRFAALLNAAIFLLN